MAWPFSFFIKLISNSLFQSEAVTMRSENSRLSNLIRSQYGPAAESLITPISQAINSLSINGQSSEDYFYEDILN